MGKRIWQALTKPWLAPLMADVVLCRIVVAVCAALGAAAALGITIWGCAFYALTGIPCPGCGMTRAVTALLCGQWSQAIAYHPLSPAYFAMGALLGAAAIAPATLRAGLIQRVRRLEERTALPALIVLCTIIFGLLRMGGACSNDAVTQTRPSLRSWLSTRMADQEAQQTNR